MAQPVTDDELQLRKRARRRLVGAIVLVLLVVVFLPMVLDNEPRPLAPNVVVTIPPQGSAESKFPERPPASAVPATPGPTASPGGAPGSPPASGMPDAKRPDPPVVPGQVPPLEVIPTPSGEAARTPPPATLPSTGASATGKPESPVVKGVEPRKPDDTARQESPRKPDEPRKRDEPGKPEEPRKPVASAAAAAVEPPANAKPGTPAANGPWVIQLGAFSDQNNAKQLVERVRALDLPGYTEATKTSAGLKTRVRAGPFAAHDAADAARAKLLSLDLAQSDLKVVRQGE